MHDLTRASFARGAADGLRERSIHKQTDGQKEEEETTTERPVRGVREYEELECMRPFVGCCRVENGCDCKRRYQVYGCVDGTVLVAWGGAWEVGTRAR